MGDKLQGIGVYVQPLGRNRASFGESDIESSSDPQTISPVDGAKGTSYKFVAPYFYAQVWIIDAKTMKVLEKKERYDFMRLYDPNSTSVNVANSIPPEVLAAQVDKFVERASAKAISEALWELIVNEPK